MNKDTINPLLDPGAVALMLGIVGSVALLLYWLRRDAVRQSDDSASTANLWDGVCYALAAAACWSIGNILMRLTAHKLPVAAGFEIALVNYVVAALALLAGGWAMGWRGKQKMVLLRAESRVKFWSEAPVKFGFVALFKGVNTLSWILAVSMISAAANAALENLHVVWTVVFLALFWRAHVPASAWANIVIGALLLALGTMLIVGTQDFGSGNTIGILLGVVSGLSFSAFYVLWERAGQRPEERWQRSVEMGGLLFVAIVLLFPLYFIVNVLWLQRSALSFHLTGSDVFIQALSGLIGIGAMYWLVNEALNILKGQRLASLVLGVGLAYSVPITMLLEIWFLGLETALVQWIGSVLFFIGSVLVLYEQFRNELLKGPEQLKRTGSEETHAQSGSVSKIPGRRWLHYTPGNDTTVVFVHGILSGPEGFRHPGSGTFWPDLLHTDDRIGRPNVFLGQFYTAVDSGVYDIPEAAGELKRQMSTRRTDGKPAPIGAAKLVFVAHSTGGLVVRDLLTRYPELFRGKKVGLVLMASPSRGSEWAGRIKMLIDLAGNRMAGQLQKTNEWVADLDRRFASFVNKTDEERGFALCGTDLFENHFLLKKTLLRLFVSTTVVVSERDSASYFGAGIIVPDTDHFSVVKPDSLEHLSHFYLVDWWEEKFNKM